MKVKCDYCGKEIKKTRWELMRSKHHFCSRVCKYKWQSEKLSGSENPNWRNRTVKHICELCGKEFVIREYDIACGKRKGKYCSNRCAGKAHSKKVKRTCQTCGKEFEVSLWGSEHGRGKYCSKSCAGKAIRQTQNISKQHTKPEMIFGRICEDCNLPFHYVGDGSLWIGKEKVLNPDFCELNGKKIVVDILGDYWHSPLLNRNVPEYATLNYRRKHYKKYGWKAIFFWESDLKREDNRTFVLAQLRREGVINEN